MSSHTCPDCSAQLSAETSLEAHRAAVKRAIDKHDNNERVLRAAKRAHANAGDVATKEKARLAIVAAEKAVATTKATADVARKCSPHGGELRFTGRDRNRDDNRGATDPRATAGARPNADRPTSGDHDELDDDLAVSR
jgi:hypothetical protein